MKARALLAVAAVSVSVLCPLSSVSLADPPRTCGVIKSSGLIVRVHQINCRTGLRWARAYAAHRAVPRGYTCAPYRGPMAGIPWLCRDNRVSYREFWVIRPAA